MPIDVASEPVFPLSEAHAHANLPHRPSLNTWYRWSDPSRGTHGVVLETCFVGGTRCTSAAALKRFSEAVTAKVAEERAAKARAKAEKATAEAK